MELIQLKIHFSYWYNVIVPIMTFNVHNPLKEGLPLKKLLFLLQPRHQAALKMLGLTFDALLRGACARVTVVAPTCACTYCRR